MDLSIVIPCLDEEGNVEQLLRELSKSVASLRIQAEIIIVDDGSQDKTVKLARFFGEEFSLDLQVCSHATSLGIFSSWRTGANHAKGDFTLFMDADLQNKPKSIVDLWREMQHRNSHFVQGVRIPTGDFGRIRARDSKALNFILNLCYKDKALDSKSGFFIAPTSVALDILQLKKKGGGYFFPHTFIRLSAISRGYSVSEVKTPFGSRVAGKSIFDSKKLFLVYAKVIADVIKGLSEFRTIEHPARRALIDFSRKVKANKAFQYKGLRKLQLDLYYLTMPLHAWLLRPSSKQIFMALRKTQFAEASELRQFQTEQLQRIVWHAYVNVPYYRTRMLSAGVYPEEIRNLEDVQKLPLLSKDELAENLHYGMFDKNTKWQTLHKVVTSGSTGRPSTTYAEQVQLEVRHGTTLRSVEWTGWKVGDRQMRLWHQTLGMSLSQITRERLDSLLMRRKFIPAFELTELSLQNLVEKIRKFRPVLLDGYAESLNFLATFANSGRPILNGPRFVISSAQVLTAQTRSEIEKSTGAKVFDKYGAREFSGIAYECMEGTRHVMAESYIVELLKDGKPARVGEVGEVIITDLNNFAVPMIRFRIGDLVTQVEQKTCGCGRNMMSIGEIQGRTQALVHCSNGRWIPGTFFAHFFKEHEDQVRFFQVVQERRGSFTLSIVKNDDFLEASWSKTLNELRDFVGDTEVRVDFVDEIPLLRTGKRTPVVSHVKVDFQSV